MRTLFQRMTGTGSAVVKTGADKTGAEKIGANKTGAGKADENLQQFSTEREKLVAEAKAWGYFKGAISTRRDLWGGKRVLDIGMGGGPHAVSFIEGGAAGYVGVDPHVGTERVRDFRNPDDPSFPAYHAFAYSTDEIMRILPNVHLYSGTLENVADKVKAHAVDVAIMSAVTEHLQRPHDVVRTIWETLQPGGHLWLCHCNYYSWTGHHRNPRSVAKWDRANKDQAKHVDWQHLEPTHPDYSDANYNRIRIRDLRAVIETYFEIVEWKTSVEALERLTPQLRRKWRKYTLEELLGQNIYITARRRDVPLAQDLSRLELHHPSETYLSDADHSNEDIGPYTLANTVYFTSKGVLCSHSDNDHAGLRVFARLKPGDVVTVKKFDAAMRLTVAEVVRPKGGDPRVILNEAIPDAVINGNRDQWTIAEFGPSLYGPSFDDSGSSGRSSTGPNSSAPNVVGSASRVASSPSPTTTPPRAPIPSLPGLDLMTATLNAIDVYAADMGDVRYLIAFAKQISAEPYQALQARYAERIAASSNLRGAHAYLDLPYWVAHKLLLARTLRLMDGPRRSLLDLGTGAGHLLRIAMDHGHQAIGVDVANPIYADCADLLGIDRRVSPILPMTPLPDFGRKFDLVTAICIKFDVVGRGPAPTYWTPAEWAFLVNDLMQNHAQFPFRVHIILNEHPLPDGRTALPQETLTWFAAQGATVDNTSGTIDLQVAAPRHIKAS